MRGLFPLDEKSHSGRSMENVQATGARGSGTGVRNWGIILLYGILNLYATKTWESAFRRTVENRKFPACKPCHSAIADVFFAAILIWGNHSTIRQDARRVGSSAHRKAEFEAGSVKAGFG